MLLYHNEPIWRDGALVGETSSGMWGHTLQRSLALGYVANPNGIADAAYIDSGTYEIEVAGQRLPARVSLQPLYDPKSLRVKA
jgi:4-methylaminobutanoate oxidase (formaldehyde-forming)